jgi:hypothetical protein
MIIVLPRNCTERATEVWRRPTGLTRAQLRQPLLTSILIRSTNRQQLSFDRCCANLAWGAKAQLWVSTGYPLATPMWKILTNSHLEGHTETPPRSGNPALVVLAVPFNFRVMSRIVSRSLKDYRQKLTTKSPHGREWSSGLCKQCIGFFVLRAHWLRSPGSRQELKYKAY